jgi:hypothetical protein
MALKRVEGAHQNFKGFLRSARGGALQGKPVDKLLLASEVDPDLDDVPLGLSKVAAIELGIIRIQ